MKLREFVNLYAGDEVLMNLLSEDGTEFDTVPIDPSLASTNRINKKWLDGEVEYFDFHDDELHVSVSIPTVTASTSRKRSFTITASRSSHPSNVYEYVLKSGTWEKGDIIDTFDNKRDAEDYIEDVGSAFPVAYLYLVIYEYDVDGEYYPSSESPILLKTYRNGI